MAENSIKYPCPCCGYKTHDRADSLWDICEVCFWENEPLTLANPFYVGGPNSTSLVQGQQNFLLFGAYSESAKSHVRKPKENEARDLDWKTIDFDQNLIGEINEHLIKNIYFNDNWRQDWHTIKTEQFGITSKQKGIWILAHRERFTIEFTFGREPETCELWIKESDVRIFHQKSTDLVAAKIVLNRWIADLDEKFKTILENKGDLKKEFDLRMNAYGKPMSAKLTCWINYDWGHAQIRNAQLQIGQEIIKVNYTFLDFERMLFHIQRNELSDDRRIQSCFFCRYSTYNVAGNDDFGDLNCFKACKEKIIHVKNKHDVIDLFESEIDNFVKVEETHHCPEYADVVAGDGQYKLLIR